MMAKLALIVVVIDHDECCDDGIAWVDDMPPRGN